MIKKILIYLVQLYQRYAPARIRQNCRFEPSCSNYMIMSIKKYGTKKGLLKGIDRLKRCKPPNGGLDLP